MAVSRPARSPTSERRAPGQHAGGDPSLAASDDRTGSRLDRELNELLSELRVALPGVQVMFAFLLTVPFAQRFGGITAPQKTAYFVAFIATALASALLLAPAAYHRVQWRRGDKERLLRIATRLALAGFVALAVAVSAAVFVVTDLLYATGLAAAVTAGVATTLVAFWFVLPVSGRFRHRRVWARTSPRSGPRRR